MKYKHALFLYPYVEINSTSLMKIFPPTGLEYVATAAKGLVDKITLVDLRYEKELCEVNKFLEFILSEKIDIICANITWNRQFEEVCKLLNQMPTGIPLILGGYKATVEGEDLFQACPRMDVLVRGEGEETIREILEGVQFEKILGISYKKNGGVNHNNQRPLPDINTISPPDRSLRRYRYYMSSNALDVTNLTFDTVLSSRGCPFNCKFCTFNLNPLGQKRGYVTRNIKSVIDEIEGTEAKAILFSDDNFFYDTERAEEICDLIIKRNIKKRFVVQSRIEIAKHPKLLEKAVKAGFKMFLIGIESPHDKVLHQFNKGFNQKMIRECFKVLKKYPLYYHGYFIYGNIGETEEEMLYIAQFAKEIGVHSITFQKLKIEKFSQLKEVVKNTPGYHINQKSELYSDKYSHATLKKIGRKIRFSFYTPARLVNVLRKLIVIKFFTLREVLSLIAASPRLIARMIGREIKRNRLGDSLKRMFVKNT